MAKKGQRPNRRRTPPPVEDCSPDGGCIPVKRQRRPSSAFSDEKLEVLEKAFARCKYPDHYKREELADRTQLSEAQVKTWFANRRAKQRKQGSFSSPVSLGMNPVSGNSDTIKVPPSPPPRGSKRRSSSQQERPPKRPRKVSRDRALPDRAIAGPSSSPQLGPTEDLDTIKVPPSPSPRRSKRRSSSQQERPPKRPRKVSRDRASPDRATAGPSSSPQLGPTEDLDTIKVPPSPSPRRSKRRSSSQQERPPKRPRKVSRDRASPDRATAGPSSSPQLGPSEGPSSSPQLGPTEDLDWTKCRNCEETCDSEKSWLKHQGQCMHRPIKCPDCSEVVELQMWLHEHNCQPESSEEDDAEDDAPWPGLPCLPRRQGGFRPPSLSSSSRAPSDQENIMGSKVQRFKGCFAQTEEEPEEEFVIEDVLDKRFTADGTIELFVKREGYPHSANTWIRVDNSPENMKIFEELLEKFKRDRKRKIALEKEKETLDNESEKIMDVDGDMERTPRGSGPRNRPPYKSRMDRRRPSRGQQSRHRAGAPSGKRDDGDAPNKSDASDDYESKSDENNSDNVNVSPSSNQLSSGSGEPSDSAQTNEGYSNENSPEQDQGSGTRPASPGPDLEEHEIAKMEQSRHEWQQEFATYVRWFHSKGLEAPIPSCLKEALDADARADEAQEDSADGWLDSDEDNREAEEEQGFADGWLDSDEDNREAEEEQGFAEEEKDTRSPSPHPPSPLCRRRLYPAIPLTPSSASSSSGEPSSPQQPPTPPPRQSPRPTRRSDRGMRHVPTRRSQRRSPPPPILVPFRDAPGVIPGAIILAGTPKLPRFWQRNGDRTSLRSSVRVNYNDDAYFDFHLKGLI